MLVHARRVGGGGGDNFPSPCPPLAASAAVTARTCSPGRNSDLNIVFLSSAELARDPGGTPHEPPPLTRASQACSGSRLFPETALACAALLLALYS